MEQRRGDAVRFDRRSGHAPVDPLPGTRDRVVGGRGSAVPHEDRVSNDGRCRSALALSERDLPRIAPRVGSVVVEHALREVVRREEPSDPNRGGDDRRRLRVQRRRSDRSPAIGRRIEGHPHRGRRLGVVVAVLERPEEDRLAPGPRPREPVQADRGVGEPPPGVGRGIVRRCLDVPRVPDLDATAEDDQLKTAPDRRTTPRGVDGRGGDPAPGRRRGIEGDSVRVIGSRILAAPEQRLAPGPEAARSVRPVRRGRQLGPTSHRGVVRERPRRGRELVILGPTPEDQLRPGPDERAATDRRGRRGEFRPTVRDADPRTVRHLGRRCRGTSGGTCALEHLPRERGSCAEQRDRDNRRDQPARSRRIGVRRPLIHP